ncbi:anti-sigma B factor antagonist [Tangfeifania diversioriginum]|uniref:Anti-sigma factor antagonist n=1 Tax=Tangfeifania diversioriginum TaxID=1168035 RepID=A0A1M6LDP2_9BACT|nr:STAS domain-containing protein [Tangfeifania diversioriginum]SHJ69314.1 anti-sigma B factor antagonist [Tangfeifania diversioriginum]
MSLEIQKNKDYTLVKVQTERLDTNTAPDLKSELVVLNNNGHVNIILDISQCKYCDSSGLRAILVGNRLSEDAIGTFVLTGLQPDVENLIRISMLHTVLLITKTVEEAEELLKKKKEM